MFEYLAKTRIWDAFGEAAPEILQQIAVKSVAGMRKQTGAPDTVKLSVRTGDLARAVQDKEGDRITKSDVEILAERIVKNRYASINQYGKSDVPFSKAAHIKAFMDMRRKGYYDKSKANIGKGMKAVRKHPARPYIDLDVNIEAPIKRALQKFFPAKVKVVTIGNK